MGRTSAALAALAVVAGLAACGQDDVMPAPAPEGSPASGAGSILTGSQPLLNGTKQDLADPAS